MKTKNKIIKNINNNEKVIRYKELEQIINNNEKIQDYLSKIKTIQKEIVHAKALGKLEKLKQLKLEYNKMLDEINSFPLMAEYMDLQEEINDFLQNMKEMLEIGINSDLTTK